MLFFLLFLNVSFKIDRTNLEITLTLTTKTWYNWAAQFTLMAFRLLNCITNKIPYFLFIASYFLELCLLDVNFRGSAYPGIRPSYPMDSIEVSGLFRLERNDRIYVSKLTNFENNPNGEQYLVGDDKAQFGAFRI